MTEVNKEFTGAVLDARALSDARLEDEAFEALAKPELVGPMAPVTTMTFDQLCLHHQTKYGNRSHSDSKKLGFNLV